MRSGGHGGAREAKGPNRLCLITDAMEAMGMPDGVYELGGQAVILKDGECRLESGSLVGSVLSMDRAVANMVKLVGVDLVSAVRMASLTPAESVGLGGSRGSLTVGKYGDVVLLDSNSLLCTATMVEGRIYVPGCDAPLESPSQRQTGRLATCAAAPSAWCPG